MLRSGVIIDVDDNFFTGAFFGIGLLYSLGKAYNRYLLEEVAFERRKAEARERRLEEDPASDELELRREESAGWPSVYARKFRGEGETIGEGGRGGGFDAAGGTKGKRGSPRVAVADRDDDGDDDDDDDDEAKYGLSDEEIEDFESQTGVEYDPYYGELWEFRLMLLSGRINAD